MLRRAPLQLSRRTETIPILAESEEAGSRAAVLTGWLVSGLSIGGCGKAGTSAGCIRKATRWSWRFLAENSLVGRAVVAAALGCTGSVEGAVLVMAAMQLLELLSPPRLAVQRWSGGLQSSRFLAEQPGDNAVGAVVTATLGWAGSVVSCDGG